MKTLIVGMGEVGAALFNVLKDYNPHVIDPKLGEHVGPNALEASNIEIMHITFPFSDKFVEYVKEYQEKYKPKYTVVHATVKPGTCEQLGAVHSPTIGIHPFLESGMRTFTKFLGGKDASEVANYFRRVGLKVYLFDSAKTTELMKLLDTTYYALCVEYTKNIKRLCNEHNIPFEAWSVYNAEYNRGYTQLGYPEYVRPNLVPIMTPQGGHCTIPNCDLLGGEFSELVKNLNKK
ncbi:MAG: hypothetical protein WAV09_04015 [Minisyncoccia bacterium]